MCAERVFSRRRNAAANTADGAIRRGVGTATRRPSATRSQALPSPRTSSERVGSRSRWRLAPFPSRRCLVLRFALPFTPELNSLRLRHSSFRGIILRCNTPNQQSLRMYCTSLTRCLVVWRWPVGVS